MGDSNNDTADLQTFCLELQRSAHTAHGADLEALCAQLADTNGEMAFDALLGLVRRLVPQSASEGVLRGAAAAAGSLRGPDRVHYAAFLSSVRAGGGGQGMGVGAGAGAGAGGKPRWWWKKK